LVVVWAGDASLHLEWLKETMSVNFDILVSYYGDTPDKFKDGVQYYAAAKDLKWSGLSKLLSQRPDLFAAYDAVWVPDDDILTTGKTISQMFDLFHEHSLWLAQPALGPGSYFTYRATTQVVGAKLRYVGFVEIMCPIFSRTALALLGPSFSFSASGWGLDLLWPHLLKNPRNRVAILDATPVIYTRPAGSGVFSAMCRKVGVCPRRDLANILSQYGLEWQSNMPVYGTVALAAKKSVLRQKPIASEHVKPPASRGITGKKLHIPEVDWAVCINLEHRPERWNAFQSRARAAGLGFVTRFQAINGNDLPLPSELKPFSGAYGCLHSHAAIYKESLRIGASYILVLEDDCVFAHNMALLSDYLTATIGEFSWIHLGGTEDCYPQNATLYPAYVQVTDIVNTHAYVIEKPLMLAYTNWLSENPFPKGTLSHSDRLLGHLCRRNSLNICIPHKPFAWQDKSLPRDVRW
jgi:hypothetical protein